MIPLLMKGHDSLVGMMSGIFPQLTFLTKAMTGPSVLSFLIFLLITAAGVAVFGLIAGKLYFAGAMGMQETSTKRRKVTSAEAKTLSRKRSVLSACTRQEVRELVRTPSYFMNCVLMAFLWPVIFIAVLAFQMVRNWSKLWRAFVNAGSWQRRRIGHCLVCPVLSVSDVGNVLLCGRNGDLP